MPRGHGKRTDCRHCDIQVSLYRLQRHHEEQQVANGGVRDERWRTHIITFKKWLLVFSYEKEPE